jgi:hypothetical protein
MLISIYPPMAPIVVTHARNAVRDLKARQPSKDIVVYIREGTYQLENTVVFGLKDSGVGDSTVTYAAYPW